MTTNKRTHTMKFNKNNSRNKIFIGGLASDINEKDLIDYFEQYSQIADCVVLMDKITNHSRGFGFITIEDASMVDTILNSQPHVIKGKRVECKKAIPKEVIQTQNDLFTEEVIRRKQNNDIQFYSRKLFIGGLPLTLTEEEMIRYFSQYGEVESCLIKKEEETGKSRGFGFILFVHPESIRNVLAFGHNHFILGKWIECKQAHPKEFQESQSQSSINANININANVNNNNNNNNGGNNNNNANTNVNGNNIYSRYHNQNSLITQQNNLLNLYMNTNALSNKCSNAIKQNVNMNMNTTTSNNNNNTNSTNTTRNQQIGQNDTNTLYNNNNNNKSYTVLDNQPTFNKQMKLFKSQNHITNSNSQFSSLNRNYEYEYEENDHNININNIYQRQSQFQARQQQRQIISRQSQQQLNSIEDLDARSNNPITNNTNTNTNNISNITTTTLNENNSNKAIEDKDKDKDREALIAYNRTNSNNSNPSPIRPTLNNIRDIDTISNYFNNCIKNPECTSYINYKLFDSSGQEVSKLAYKNSGRVQLFFDENNTISKDSDKDVLFKGKSTSNNNNNTPNETSHLIHPDHNHWKQTRNFRLKTDKYNFDNSNGQYKPY